MADMYYKGHWYGADDREEFLDLIRVGESNVSGNIWEGGFYPPYTVAEAKEAYAMGLYHDRENGRTARKEIALFDAIHAELIGERNAEKARVRNRRKADRKHVAENWEQEKLNRKDRHIDYVCRDSRRKYGHGKTCYWASNAERKIVHAERNIRADFEVECGNRDDALAYHSDYLGMAIDHGERLECLRKQIRKLDYERMVIENYDREIKYEQNRVNELMRIAYTIMEGECY